MSPITAREWFLYHLFNDEEFAAIRAKWRHEVDQIDSGEPGKDGLLYLEQETLTERYVELLREQFGISENVARDGLRYTKWNRTLNRNRVPLAKIEGGFITIRVGVDTRMEDVKELWNLRVEYLQRQLPGFTSHRSSQVAQPLLAYIVYKQLKQGRKMVDVHKAYIDGTLDYRIPPKQSQPIEDFRKDYKAAVQGLLESS